MSPTPWMSTIMMRCKVCSHEKWLKHCDSGTNARPSGMRTRLCSGAHDAVLPPTHLSKQR